MFKTAHDEEGDRKNAGKKFSGRRFGTKGDKNGKANENIAECAKDDGRANLERDFCEGDASKSFAQKSRVCFENAA